MTLREKQSRFAELVSEFLTWLYSSGYEVTFGEVYRPDHMQKWYFDNGFSTTMNSLHNKKLAIDLNIFKNGKWITDKNDLINIGTKWEAMDNNNRWGGFWKKPQDTDHFQYGT
jgi:D-alanyl-D-alanine dipeptidase